MPAIAADPCTGQPVGRARRGPGGVDAPVRHAQLCAPPGRRGATSQGDIRERGVGVEATKLLKEQHDEVKELFEQFEAAEEDSEKQELFERIADDFAAHGEIEEKI